MLMDIDDGLFLAEVTADGGHGRVMPASVKEC